MNVRVFYVVALICSMLLAWPSMAAAQTGERSSWGVAATFVPEWHVPPSLEILAALHFSEDEISIKAQNLRGKDFRVGIARGRALDGDWGVSFVRRTFDDGTSTGINGSGCSGGGQGSSVVRQCEELSTDLVRRGALLNGFEAHKFIPFVTIARRVQVGANIAGGIGWVSGEVDVTSYRTSYRCTYPPGVSPDFEYDFDIPFAQCAGATISNVATVQTGSGTGDYKQFLKSESGMLPIGRVEIGAAVIVTPQLKVRVAGGLNYPGVNAIAGTGVYFFRGE